MIIQGNYEINVATPPTSNAAYGKHYCKIELGSCTEKEAKEKFEYIESLFPLQWNLTLQKITCYGEVVK